jgi:hypothetical protein
MSVPSAEVVETYFSNSASTVDAGHVAFFSCAESLTLNHVGGSPPLATEARLTGELDSVAAGVDDVLLWYLRICTRDS